MKGQITVEYLVILVIMVLLFTSISMDLSEFSLENAMQMQTNSLMRASESVLLSSVKEVSLQGDGAKKSVSVRAPSDCAFKVMEYYISLDCREASFSSEEFDGMRIAEIDTAAYAGVRYLPITIENGEIGIVQVRKN